MSSVAEKINCQQCSWFGVLMMNLEEAVLKLNDKDVRLCFEQDPSCLDKTEDCSLLLHRMLLTVHPKEIYEASGRRVVVYILRNHGLDVNSQDNGGNTALHLALERHGDAEICEALLQCGADMFLPNKIGMTAHDYAVTHPSVPDETKELMKKYKPGLWQAVEDDDLMNVRKLINLWCRVDLVKNGRTLKEAVLDKGTEDIIRLVIDIAPSMKLAHSVMAGDVQAVEQLCSSDLKLNCDFKNLGDMGATPLFYAIMQNSCRMVELLCNKGAKIDVTITFEDQDIPLYFVALHRTVDTNIIKHLTPNVKEMPSFVELHYKGLNAVQFAVENSVSPHAIKHIIKQGFPELLCMRDQSNLCPWEVAETMGNTACIDMIDEIVHEWYLDNDTKYRKTLALYGYPYLREARKDGVCAYEVIQSMETSSEQAKFDSQLETYQDQISKLHQAVEAGDFSAVQSLLYYDVPAEQQCFYPCLANSFTKTDGQPLLHKAVLRRHTRIVELICQTLVNVLKIKLDTVWDAWHRTALHYAYGIPEAKETIYILQDFGCSDFTMDKDGRSPLVFYDNRHQPQMSQLILHHLNREYSKSEPQPWTVRRIQLAGGSHGNKLHCDCHSNHSCSSSVSSTTRHRIAQVRRSFNESFLLRLLNMGSHPELMLRQPDLNEFNEGVIEEVVYSEEDEEEGTQYSSQEMYTAATHRRHSQSCVVL